MSDERLKLAYDAAVGHLAQQDVTLGNLRNRATGVLSAAALVTSFSSTMGLLNTDKSKGAVFPTWGSITLLVIVIISGLLAMIVLWPIRRWVFGPAVAAILNAEQLGEDIDTIRRNAATSLASQITQNARVIDRRAQCFRGLVVLFIAEVAVLIAAVIN